MKPRRASPNRVRPYCSERAIVLLVHHARRDGIARSTAWSSSSSACPQTRHEQDGKEICHEIDDDVDACEEQNDRLDDGKITTGHCSREGATQSRVSKQVFDRDDAAGQIDERQSRSLHNWDNRVAQRVSTNDETLRTPSAAPSGCSRSRARRSSPRAAVV